MAFIPGCTLSEHARPRPLPCARSDRFGNNSEETWWPVEHPRRTILACWLIFHALPCFSPHARGGLRMQGHGFPQTTQVCDASHINVVLRQASALQVLAGRLCLR